MQQYKSTRERKALLFSPPKIYIGCKTLNPAMKKQGIATCTAYAGVAIVIYGCDLVQTIPNTDTIKSHEQVITQRNTTKTAYIEPKKHIGALL